MKKQSFLFIITGLLLSVTLGILPGASVVSEAAGMIYGVKATEETEERTSDREGARDGIPGGITIDDGPDTGQYFGNRQNISSRSSLTIDYTPAVRRAGGENCESEEKKLQITVPILQYLYLRNEGFSAASAAGILANMERDTNYLPDSGDLSGAFGLYQLRGNDLQNMISYCALHGLSPESGLAQSEAMVKVIAPDLFGIYSGREGVYTFSDRKTVTDGNHAFEPGYIWWLSSLSLSEFKEIGDPELAAEIWRRIVVRNDASGSDIAMRGRMARNIYEQMKDTDVSGANIVLQASRYLGNPYLLGGNSLTDGIDCSHFVCRILNDTGNYEEEYRNSEALRITGTRVPSLSEAVPGDVLCYNGHVAFYLSEGMVIHAASPARGIVLDTGVDIENMVGQLLSIRRIR